MVYAHLRYSDKPFMGSVTAGTRAADSLELARIGFGGDLGDRTVMTSLINASSPLVWDATDARRRAGVRRRQPGLRSSRRSSSPARWRRSPPRASPRRRSPRRSPGMTFTQLVRPGAPGGVRIVRVVDVDADRRADVRHSRAVARALRRRAARAAARRAVPIGRIVVRVEAPRRASGVRVGQHPAGDRARRRQLRAPCRGLARGRSRHRLREVHPRRRPARHDGHVRARASTSPRTARRSTPSARTDPGSTSSAPRTRSPTSRTPSTGRPRPTTRATSSGSKTVGSTPRSAPTRIWKSRLAAYEPPPIDAAVDEELREFVEPAQVRDARRDRLTMPDGIRAVGRPGVRGAAAGREHARRHQRRRACRRPAREHRRPAARHARIARRGRADRRLRHVRDRGRHPRARRTDNAAETLVARAHPVLAALVDTDRRDVGSVGLEGDEVVYLDHVETANEVTLRDWTGARLPLACRVVGTRPARRAASGVRGRVSRPALGAPHGRDR